MVRRELASSKLSSESDGELLLLLSFSISLSQKGKNAKEIEQKKM
jgi:hypothetical protein